MTRRVEPVGDQPRVWVVMKEASVGSPVAAAVGAGDGLGGLAVGEAAAEVEVGETDTVGLGDAGPIVVDDPGRRASAATTATTRTAAAPTASA